MSGNKCEYYGCRNNKRCQKDIKYHRIPKKNDISKQWILNSGEYTILYEYKQKNNKKKYLYKFY